MESRYNSKNICEYCWFFRRLGIVQNFCECCGFFLCDFLGPKCPYTPNSHTTQDSSSCKNVSRCSFPWVQMEKISSTYLNHTRGVLCWGVGGSTFGTNGRSWNLLFNGTIKLKNLFSSTNPAILINVSVGTSFCSLFSKAFLTSFNLAHVEYWRKDALRHQ